MFIMTTGLYFSLISAIVCSLGCIDNVSGYEYELKRGRVADAEDVWLTNPSDSIVATDTILYDTHHDDSGGDPVTDSNSAASDSSSTDNDVATEVDGNTVATPCTINDECDDGIFCNGIEECAAGTCLSGKLHRCDDHDPLTEDFCDPVQEVCGHYPRECGTELECDDGDPCTVKRCIENECRYDDLVCWDPSFRLVGLCDPEPGNYLEDEVNNFPCRFVECLHKGDCNDDNPETTDVCENHTCVHISCEPSCQDMK